ncbi:2-amino-4-hydroxy-6-hydroxymethyldihydropteridine diphosphokinase [uncultured Bacteroides sp.]|uniref:2-amino-4-hydroxy-6- hydroxymethyldihydropteridine diphosphokinase n=1 Tax=uncultured Bacteroides sp. TaxID=162156 RepID=UPI00260373B1|nr:2-amino-4-hydroxy-6-hydroxymethyldihydropteridine diphosphokinase [uncultured Bacteroides sp.]
MAKVYLGLGTNLGDKEANLHTAVRLIKEKIGEVTSLSSFYATEPWGFTSENAFLNAAACVETQLGPQEVLQLTQEIEKELGRTKKSSGGVYSDRLIDIDLLLWDDLILETPELTLPHPLMTERSFVMDPLVEIAPDYIHPILHKPLRELKPLTDKENSDK